ncbi:MAG: gephyrin-like molybdotransferase Glp [Pseudomonadota bacterium]
MISVDAALGHLFALALPVGIEEVPLSAAAGRTLAREMSATRDQPPFPSSAMDGYAVRGADLRPGAVFDVVGISAAGHGSDIAIGPGQALRIFTGAPVPHGADRIVIQEDVTRAGDQITIGDAPDAGPYVRPAGGDFKAGDTVTAPRVLGPADLSLLAAMNHATVPCRRRPDVAILATGDELVMPGETPRPDQIIASNGVGLKALIEGAGGTARLLPIARDTEAALHSALDLAKGADLVVTMGGASVGDHDLVGPVAAARGMTPAFYKVAMRPGKPLMAGRLDGAAMIGLPGNPVSTLVCGTVFIVPLLRAMLGFEPGPAPRRTVQLARDIPENGPREHYMRARLTPDGIAPFDRQDSSLLSVIADANALLIRPVRDPARRAGDTVDYLPL